MGRTGAARVGLVVAAVLATLLVPTAPASAAPPAVIGAGFVGGDGKPPAHPYADADVAAGPGHVVQVSGSRLDVHDRAGKVLRKTPLATFFGVAGAAGVGQARVLYDHRGGGRWVVAALADDVETQLGPEYWQSDDVAVLAVSRTGDPLGGWTVAAHVLASAWYDLDGYVGEEAEHLRLGLSGDAIVVSYRHFDGKYGLGSPEILAWPKAALYAGRVASPHEVPWSERLDGATLFGAATPAIVTDGATDAWVAIVDDWDVGPATVALYRGSALGTPGNGLRLVTTLPLGWSDAPVARQPGSAPALSGPDAEGYAGNGFFVRLGLRAWQVRDRLWLSATVADGARPAVAWAEVSTATGAVVQKGIVHASATSHDVNPAIAATAAGDAFLTWTSTDPAKGTRVQVRVSGRRAGDPAGVIPAGRVVQTSPASATTGAATWGRSAGVALDPVAAPGCPYGGRAYATNQYNLNATTWGTKVVRFGFC